MNPQGGFVFGSLVARRWFRLKNINTIAGRYGVISPSTLGNSAEIRAMMKIIPIIPLNSAPKGQWWENNHQEEPGCDTSTHKDESTPPKKRKRKLTSTRTNETERMFFRSFNGFYTDVLLHHFWSRPVMAIAIKAPPSKCFEKRTGIDMSVLKCAYIRFHA